MANKWEDMTQEELVKQRDANSAAWAPADDVERVRLHDENVEIQGELDRRNSTASTFDPASGTWTTKTAQPDYTKVYSDPTPKPEYSGTWQRTTEDLTRQAMGMTYEDWTKGTDYQALAGRYRDMGRMAMDDTVGQVSARTGGLASSYATSAAQQRYNQYMSQLEEVARQMYAAQRGDAIQNAQLAGTMADREYNQYLNQLGQYNTDRAFGYGVYRDQVGDSQWQQDFDYRAGRAQVSDQRFDQEQALAQLEAMIQAGYEAWELPYDLVQQSGADSATLEAMERKYAKGESDQRQADIRAQLDAIIQAGGTPSQEMIDASGYSNEYVQALVSAYQRQQQAAAKTYSHSGGSGLSGGDDAGGMDYDGLFAAAKASGNPRSFLSQKTNYQKYGFTSSSGLYNDYQIWEEKRAELYGKGTAYNVVFENAKYMSRSGVPDEEITSYLRQFTDEQLTEAGWEAIAMGLDLKGYRTKRGNT